MALDQHIIPFLSVLFDVVIALFEIVRDWKLDVILQWDVFEDEGVLGVERVISGGFGIAAQYCIDLIAGDDILP